MVPERPVRGESALEPGGRRTLAGAREGAPGSVSGMQWTTNVSAGDWIRERLEPELGPGAVIPSGFAAYARVLHPAWRSRPVGRAWPVLPGPAEWEAMQGVEVDTERARWSQVAAAFGTTLHPLAQFHRLTRAGDPWGNQSPLAPDGWQYDAPQTGDLEPEVVAALAEHLAAHTDTPDDGGVALWEGHGDLLTTAGGSGRAFFAVSGEVDAQVARAHNEMLQRSTRDPFNEVFLTGRSTPGILPAEVTNGPRLRLPGREHILFRGGIAELVRPDWVLHVPWRDRVAEQQGFEPSAHAPSLAWPADRAWVLVTEVDFDSTVIGGSAELVAAIVADPRLEALELPAGADLSWAGDRINV